MLSKSASDRPEPVSQALAGAIIAASGAHPNDRVLIAGAVQIELLTALLRSGFSNVACQSAACGPHAPMPKPDILMAPHVASEAELAGILHRLGRGLRPNGVAVVRAQGALLADERCVRRCFIEAGFAVERIPSRGDAAPLWCARKRAAALARAA